MATTPSSEALNTKKSNVTAAPLAAEGTAAVAVAERATDTDAPRFQDSDEVIVLYGYGRVAPDKVQFVDNVKFTGGIARDVPYAQAKHWQGHTRPDGKPTVSRINVQAILPCTATEADFRRATGLVEMPPERMAAHLMGADLDSIIASLGIAQTKNLIDGLQQRLEAARSSANIGSRLA